MKTSLERLLSLIVLIFITLNIYSQPTGKPLITFGIVTDVQYSDRENAGSRYYRSSLNKLTEAVKVFNNTKVDFVVSLGDFINDDLRSYDTLTAIASKLKMPLYHVLGNHDYAVGIDKVEEAFKILNLNNTYYSFSRKGWRFIFLNGNDVSVYANKTGTPKYILAEQIIKDLKERKARNAQEWNGAISDDQKQWMEKELQTAEKKNEKAILFCHFPLYPNGAYELLMNHEDIRALLERSPSVFAWLNGHNHVSQSFFEKEIHYISFRGMVEKDENSFAIVSIYKDAITIEGQGKEVNRLLKISN